MWGKILLFCSQKNYPCPEIYRRIGPPILPSSALTVDGLPAEMVLATEGSKSVLEELADFNTNSRYGK